VVYFPKAAVIILTTNALAMTKEELSDVAKLETKGLKATCVVVDNDSSDGTEAALKNYRLPNMDYRFIQSGANLGFAGGNNVGIKYALKNKFDYVLLLNNDVILAKDLLVKLVSFMEENPRAGLVSPKMYFAKGYEFHKDRYKVSELGKVFWYAGGIIDRKNAYFFHRGVDEIDRGQYDRIESTDFANGACVLIRRAVLTKVGLLDASFFLYCEDADFSEKAKKAGFEIYYYPKTAMWHKVSASTGGSGSPSNDYFLIRNRFYFARRYLPFRTKLAVIKDTLRLIITGRIWQKRGALDALLGRKGMGSWRPGVK